MSKKDIAKWLDLSTICLFAFSVFQIVDDRYLIAAIAFACATCIQAYTTRLKKSS